MYMRFKFPKDEEPENLDGSEETSNEEQITELNLEPPQETLGTENLPVSTCPVLPGVVPPSGSNLDMYYGKPLTLEHVLKSEQSIHKLMCINTELWAVLVNGKIQVLPVDGLRSRFITLASKLAESVGQETFVTGLTQTKCGKIVVSNKGRNCNSKQTDTGFNCNLSKISGLIETEQDGNVVNVIANGVYEDVNCNSSVLCGLQVNCNSLQSRSCITIHIHNCKSEAQLWTHWKTIELENFNFLKCIIFKSYLLLSTVWEANLHKYNFLDNCLEKVQIDPLPETGNTQSEPGLNLCFADSSNVVLFSGTKPSALRLLRPDGCVQKLEFQNKIKYGQVKAAVMDNEGNVYLSTDNGDLLKFKILV